MKVANWHQRTLSNQLKKIADLEAADPDDTPPVRKDPKWCASIIMPLDGEITRIWPEDADLETVTLNRKQITIHTRWGGVFEEVNIFKCVIIHLALRIYAAQQNYKFNKNLKRFMEGSPDLQTHEGREKLTEYIYFEYSHRFNKTFTTDQILCELHPGNWTMSRGAEAYTNRFTLVLDSMVLDGDLAKKNDDHYEITPNIVRTVERNRVKLSNNRYQLYSLITSTCSAIAALASVYVAYITFLKS